MEAVKLQEEAHAKIATLETDLRKVNQQVGGLKANIGTLETGIQETQKKLAASEGDRIFLMRELKRMQVEKDKLVAQLNNLEAVEARFRELKAKFNIALRERWNKNGQDRGPSKGTGARATAKLIKDEEAEAIQTKTIKDPKKLSISLDGNGEVTITPIEEEEDNGASENIQPDFTEPKEKGEAEGGGVVTPAPEQPEEGGQKPNPAPTTKPKASEPQPEPTKATPTPPAKPAETNDKSADPAPKPAPAKPAKPVENGENPPASKPAEPAPKPAPANP